MIHPFVRLMRRYVIDYTNSHDQAICDEIMRIDYRVHISGTVLERDANYKAAVASLFEDFPGLELEVHEIVTNGEMLAMRFTEHGASLSRGGRAAAWGGIGIYSWDGRQLTSNHVEQDFFARRRQLKSGAAAPIEPPHHDPWVGALVGGPSPGNEDIVREWLKGANLASEAHIHIDDGWHGGRAPSPLRISGTDIGALFSAGDRVAFHIVQHGVYAGGLLEDDGKRHGAPASLRLIGIVKVEDGAVTEGRIISDREGTRAALKAMA